MTDAEKPVQTTLTETVEEKASEKVSEARKAPKNQLNNDSIATTFKKEVQSVSKKVDKLPGDKKLKLFMGMGLILAALLTYTGVLWFNSKMMLIVFGVFYPVAVGAVTILSSYNQNDFFEALFTDKKKKKPRAEHPEIHDEEEIHETHEH